MSVKSKIPSPTWSITELSLTNGDNGDNSDKLTCRISDEELQKLSNRCLIDISTMDENERNKLKSELGNMMRCISLVSSYESDEPKIINQEELEEVMYDVPRGFSSTRFGPLRRDDTDETNEWFDGGAMEEANFILDHLKEDGKIHQYNEADNDGCKEWYFSVTTKKR